MDLLFSGMAAVQIGGITLHRWAGIGIINDKKVAMSRAFKHKDSWRNTTILMIDEISMISGQLFDTLEEIARYGV